jgi:hypothetical protein
MPRLAISICLLFIISGCAHVPLRRNTLKQSQTLSDLLEQQVLDNIALSIAAPHSTPYFGLPKGGSTQMTQSGSSTVSLSWNPRTLVSEVLGITGGGALTENWTLEPVTNPDRLDLMSCLLQHVTCRGDGVCQDCDSKLRVFFKDKYPSCLPTCFYGRGRKCDVPKNCAKVGRSENTYVWVTGKHYAELQAITLAMLDIITADLKEFAPPDPKPKSIKVTQKIIGMNGTELTGEFQVSREDYNKLIDSLQKNGDTKTSMTPESMSVPMLIKPSDIPESGPVFRQRRESSDGPIQSLLLLPRQ